MSRHAAMESLMGARVWVITATLALPLTLLAACGQAQPGQSTAAGAPPTFVVPTAPSAATCDMATQWNVPAGNVALDDLAVVAPGEGWAVGALTAQLGVGGSAPTGVIYHLTQGQWLRLPQTYPGAGLSTIAMDSPDDGWAASTSAITGQGDHALVLHYTGGQWRQVDIPALDKVLKGPPGTFGGSIQWISIQMFGPDAGWMFAWTNIPRDLHNPASRAEVVVLRYEHGAWTQIPAPSVDPTTELFSLSAVSGSEAWIVGTDYGPSTLTTLFAHYVNGAWSVWPTTFSGVTERLTMISPSDGWAFGSDANGESAPLHFDGASWAPVATPADWASQRLVLLPYVYPVAPGKTWFSVISRGGAALIAQYANGQWRQVAWPYADSAPSRLIPDSSGDLWGVGDIGHQRGCPPMLTTLIQQGVLLHYHQGRWSRVVLL